MIRLALQDNDDILKRLMLLKSMYYIPDYFIWEQLFRRRNVYER